jgi:hypothetical protein
MECRVGRHVHCLDVAKPKKKTEAEGSTAAGKKGVGDQSGNLEV